MKLITVERPPALVPHFDAIPDLLTARNAWMVWRWTRKWDERHKEHAWTKPPFRANGGGGPASTTDPTTWSPFEDAVEAYKRGSFDGIGIRLIDDLVGIDLDDVRDAESGELHPDAQRVVEAIASYTEISPSGRGVRIFVLGTLPTGWRNTRKWNVSIEMYDHRSPRYLTVTGWHLPGTPTTLEERTAELAQLHAEVAIAIAPAPTASQQDSDDEVRDCLDLDDDALLERARAASNGPKFARLFDHGVKQEEDHSAEDLALCVMLAFWTGRDATRIDRLFRRSALIRAKWDERHNADGRTYGAMTVGKAVANCGTTYSPNGKVGVAPQWPAPEPVPDGLPPVPAFETARLLPDTLAPWVSDVAERSQCPPDFVGVAVVISAAAVVGRQMTIRPKVHDDWTVVPNLWGLGIGRPGVMKTAAMQEAQSGLRRRIADARERHRKAMDAYEFQVASARARRAAVEKQIKSAAEHGESPEPLREAFTAAKVPDPPVEQRYVVNDSTVEKLGVLLNLNPRGLLLFRDELSGFLRTMEREGHENDRAFYCEAWNGTGSYVYDRIGRGTLHIEAACVSVLGGIQPLPLAAYLREAFRNGQDDGLIQRFQLMVYPDISPTWRNVDRRPDSEARHRVVNLFQALDCLESTELAAHQEDPELPFLRFTPEAQERFDAWRAMLEQRLRTDDEHPVLISHLAKYRSLCPSLALLFHLIDCIDAGRGGPVSLTALERAVAWCDYLEPHARRVYEGVLAPGRLVAAAMAKRLAAGDLDSPFTVRDVLRKGWAGLNASDEIVAALDLLKDLNWVRREPVRNSTGGRPTVCYHVNPLARGAKR